MFRLCSNVKVKESDFSDEVEFSDEIVKEKAFSNVRILKYISTKDFNDYDLYKLLYLGPLDYYYNNLVKLFGQPRIHNNVNGSYLKELVWFIKFNNGHICSISKYYNHDHHRRHINKFRICGNNRNVLLDLAHVLK